jgi:tRNA threonylcarbamoyladenosine biosynthesis protein TsaE
MGTSGSAPVIDRFEVTSRGPGETGRIASVLAGRLAAGDVVLLSGGLAAGKTTFVKAVAAALGSPDLVTSPTFALAQFYAATGGAILHVDTYRLADVEEYRDLGLDEYAETAVNLIEWGEKVAAEFPCHLAVDFREVPGDPDTRTVAFVSSCDRWTAVLGDLSRDVQKELA